MAVNMLLARAEHESVQDGRALSEAPAGTIEGGDSANTETFLRSLRAGCCKMTEQPGGLEYACRREGTTPHRAHRMAARGGTGRERRHPFNIEYRARCRGCARDP